MYTVYVLKSRIAQKSYVGMTDNLKRRINEHNSGESTFSKRHMPWDVIYTEIHPNSEVARNREKYLKSAAGRRFLKKNIFKE